MNVFGENLSIWPWNPGAMSSRDLAHKISFPASLRGCLQGVLCVIFRERGTLFRGRRKDPSAAMSYLVQRAQLDSSPQPYMTRFIHWEISIIIRTVSLFLSPPFSLVCKSSCMEIHVHVNFVFGGRCYCQVSSLLFEMESLIESRVYQLGEASWPANSSDPPVSTSPGTVGVHHHAWLLK